MDVSGFATLASHFPDRTVVSTEPGAVHPATHEPAGISGLARVVVSTSVKVEMPAMTRRMIFPERVVGMSGTIHTLTGRAILPISCSIAAMTWSAMSVLGARPGWRATYILAGKACLLSW